MNITETLRFNCIIATPTALKVVDCLLIKHFDKIYTIGGQFCKNSIKVLVYTRRQVLRQTFFTNRLKMKLCTKDTSSSTEMDSFPNMSSHTLLSLQAQ